MIAVAGKAGRVKCCLLPPPAITNSLPRCQGQVLAQWPVPPSQASGGSRFISRANTLAGLGTCCRLGLEVSRNHRHRYSRAVAPLQSCAYAPTRRYQSHL